ncbi:hypothetical protein BSK20_03595 [SR1 bacterium human oral taxon HOT-345]|nr:hypothetical protein BSK20_03595 [SR1 bacterium human oral taxon HOT-345]
MKYRKDSENAVKFDYPLTKESRGDIELFDREAGVFVEIAKLTNDQLAEIISYIGANGNEISEEEYKQLISEELKKESGE